LRQVTSLALMITLLFLLSSCRVADRRASQLASEIRTDYIKAQKLELTTDVKADYGDRVYDFTFKYTGDAEKGEILITAPESIAGLKATVSVKGGTLEYDGAVLDTGALTSDGLSPAEAIPLLLSQWQSGYITNTGFEKLGDTDTLSVTTDVSETITQRTWFDAKSRLPVRAELSDTGRMVLSCVFKNTVVE
jgi:outer membrane lipoprotein-sorting protein